VDERTHQGIPAETSKPADWLVADITTFAKSVLSLLPAGFEAYGRVFHPAGELIGRAWTSVSWAALAAANGTRTHAEMQLGAVIKSDPRDWGPIPTKSQPEWGNLPEALVGPITAILRAYTATPESCWFAVWEGFGALRRDILREPSFELPHRRYHLLRGPIEGVFAPCEAPFKQTANIWWPDDHAWCVATEVDLDSTYIGGSAACIAALVAAPELEAYAIDPAAGITYDSDTVNSLA
jgi:hypothetical protein